MKGYREHIPRVLGAYYSYEFGLAKATPMAQVKTVIKMSKEYGKDYGLIMATFLLSQRDDFSAEVKVLDLLLAELDFPEDIGDVELLRPGVSKTNWTESEKAINMLVALLKRKAAATQPDQDAEVSQGGKQKAQSLQASREGKRKESATEVSAATEQRWTRRKGPPKHIPKTARMTKEQHALYIDMVGYDDHNSELV